MILAKPRILIKATFLEHFTLEVWISIYLSQSLCVNFKTYNLLFTDEIHLASYTALQSSFQRFGQYIGGHVDAFSHFAVNDINNGMFNLSTGNYFNREHSCSVEECLTQNQGVAG